MRVARVILSFAFLVSVVVEGVTFADVLRNFFKSARKDVDKNGIAYPMIFDGVRRQASIPDTVPFPCDLRFSRSPYVPNSVHRLRPGDIDVIGGLGDSLVAGSGALEEFAIGTFIEARGVSWCVGGQENWRRFLTLPNLLKVFNPNLTGYSTGTGEFISTRARLNIAFPVAATEDAFQQARILVQRIKNDNRINFRKQWKLITIFFGANDICSAQCFDPEHFSPLRHALHLRRALDYLKMTLPRTLVNVVPAIDVTVSLRVAKSPMCNILHSLYCACMHRGNRPDIAASKMARMYQQAAEALINSGRYDNSEEFTVVLQPFMKLFNAPNADPSRAKPIDTSLVTYDCFHFSQKGHALGKEQFPPIDIPILNELLRFRACIPRKCHGFNDIRPYRACKLSSNAFGIVYSNEVEYNGLHIVRHGRTPNLSTIGANLLWNNMLEPVGNKTEEGLPRILERVLCPTERAPYIFTNVNSMIYRRTGSQDGIIPR